MVKQTDESAPTAQGTRLRELEQTLESLREDSEIAHVLLGLSAALAEVRTVEETLDKSVRITKELFSANRCFAAAWDGLTTRFKVLANYGFEPEPLDDLERLAERPDGGLPLLLQALTERQPVLMDDVAASGLIPVFDARSRHVKSYIGIPLLRWGQDFGGLGVEFTEPRTFTPKEAALARGIARQVGVALANARRFNLLQQLRGVGLRVGAKLNEGELTQEIAVGARDLLNGSGALLFSHDGANNALVASGAVDVAGWLTEGLSRISPDDGVWGELFDGHPVTVHDIGAQLGVDGGPSSAVATVIPGRGDHPLGAVMVFFDRYFTLGPDEAEALNVLAAHSASSLENAQRYQRQRRVARSLQEGLLRLELPKLDACEVHALYEPAGDEAEVGGDYYDVFDFPDGRVALVVGDVSGKGAEAAAHTAMAKYMLRAFAIRNPGPSSVLFHLNNALVQGLEEDKFTTLLYVLFDPGQRLALVAVGGHPNPLIYRSDSGLVEVVHAQGAIVGAFVNQRFEQVDVAIRPGDVLLSFTDGLTETRNDEGELFGPERVKESLARHAGLPAADLTQAVYDDARKFGSVTDDSVVFALVMKSGATS